MMLNIYCLQFISSFIGKTRCSPQHTPTTYMVPTYVVENIGICCGYTLPTTYRHPQHIQWTGVVHNIYPQHIDGIHNRYVLHNSTVHHIHPQHKICCPQQNTVMDTHATYQMSSTTYMYSTAMLSTTLEEHVVENT